MKILYFITGLETSGAETQLLHLSRGLVERGHQVRVVALLDGDMRVRYEHAGVEVVLAPQVVSASGVWRKVQKMLAIWQYMRWMRQQVRDCRPDVAHSFLSHTNILLLWAYRFRAKVCPIITSYRIVLDREPKLMWAERFAFARSDYAIANSHTGAKSLQDNFGHLGVPITHIYNGLIPQKVSDADVQAVREQYPSKRIVLTVARFYDQKDYPTNVAAAERVIAQHSNVIFAYIGTGPELEATKQLVQEKGLEEHIFFLERQHNVPAWMCASDIFFLPTKFESQANVIMEAMYYSTPIITSDVPENAELLDKNLSSLVQVGDVEQFSQAINTKLKENNDAEITRNQQFAQDTFDIQTMISRYEEIYEILK